MKTAMQELIDHLDPIHEGVKLLALKLLEAERMQIQDAYVWGVDEGESRERSDPSGDDEFEYTTPKQYYNRRYK